VNPLAPQRRALRAAMRARRAALSPAQRAASSAAICLTLSTHIPHNASVSATWPLADEPDLTPWLLTHMRGPGQLWLPRILGPGHMAFARVTDPDTLLPNRHGILEPPERADLRRLPPISHALVPGLAFDPDLNRMGQGGGFYDRWLADMRAHDPALRVWAVCFAFQLLDQPLPVLPHDQPVDRILSDAP
jgi:5-formyltetrahydrofolate cyclo-ligase